MHQIIEKYIKNQIVPDLLRELSEEEKTPIVLAIIQLKTPFHHMTTSKEFSREKMEKMAEDSMVNAKTISLNNQDPAILLIFLEIWLTTLLQYNRPTEADAINSLVQSLAVTNLPVEIVIIPAKCELIYCAFKGKLIATENKIKDIMEQVKNNEEKLLEYTTLHLARLSISGSTNEFNAILEKNKNLQESEKIKPFRFSLSISQGKPEEALKRNKIFIESTDIFNRYKNSTWYRSSLCVIQIYKYLDNNSTVSEIEATIEVGEEGWERIEIEMLKGNLEKALETSAKYLQKEIYFTLEFSFSWYTHLRCHLNNKLTVQSEALLQHKRKNNWREFDYFFWARLERLRGNQDKAKSYFKMAYDYCVKNDRLNFLEYECKLCLEAPYREIIQWYEFAKSNSKVLPLEKIKESKKTPYSVARIIGESPSMKSLKDKVLQIAKFDVPVLITGETGTGKELVARCIHDYGNNRSSPFIPINCASIAESLLQSELFGYEKGAFTGASKRKAGIFESAQNGTAFLDEIGDAPINVQLALLRVLESNEFYPIGSSKPIPLKCRILAATNATLLEKTETGNFRKDLLFRLERLKIKIPALKERAEDIIPISKYYLELNRPNKKIEISKSLQVILEAHDWPGNVRELNHLMERVNLFHPDKVFITENEIDQEFIKKSKEHKNNIATTQIVKNTPQTTATQPDSNINFINEGSTAFRRLDRLKNHFKQIKKMTRQEAAQLLKVSLNTAAKDLNILEAENFVIRIKPSASTRTHYFQICE